MDDLDKMLIVREYNGCTIMIRKPSAYELRIYRDNKEMYLRCFNNVDNIQSYLFNYLINVECEQNNVGSLEPKKIMEVYSACDLIISVAEQKENEVVAPKPDLVRINDFSAIPPPPPSPPPTRDVKGDRKRGWW